MGRQEPPRPSLYPAKTQNQNKIPTTTTENHDPLLFPLPQVLLLIMALYGVEYPFGHFELAVLVVSLRDLSISCLSQPYSSAH